MFLKYLGFVTYSHKLTSRFQYVLILKLLEKELRHYFIKCETVHSTLLLGCFYLLHVVF